MIRNIIFDFDGVLVESVKVKSKAFEELYLPYGSEFAARVVSHHEANGGVSRFDKFKLYSGEWLGEVIDEVKIEELANKFSDLVLEAVVLADMVSGADDFLKYQSQNYQCWIITGTPEDEIKEILKRRALNQYFIEVFGSPTNKNNWVSHIIKKYDINPKETIFIGDSMSDFEAAITHQINFILRETAENENQFKNYTGVRIANLKKLMTTLNNL
jgi:phosphoglycolate phosphatase-like HAD superfamily hydrolase